MKELEKYVNRIECSKPIYEIEAHSPSILRENRTSINIKHIGARIASLTLSEDESSDPVWDLVRKNCHEKFDAATLSFIPETESIMYNIKETMREHILHFLRKNHKEVKDSRSTKLYKFFAKFAFKDISYKLDGALFNLYKYIWGNDGYKDPNIIKNGMNALQILRAKFEKELTK